MHVGNYIASAELQVQSKLTSHVLCICPTCYGCGPHHKEVTALYVSVYQCHLSAAVLGVQERFRVYAAMLFTAMQPWNPGTNERMSMVGSMTLPTLTV